MNNKQILIVSQAFYPENSPRSFRATELAKEFSRQGFDVTVLTPRLDKIHDEFETTFQLKIENMGAYTWKPIILKGRWFEFTCRRLFSRIAGLFFEYPSIQLFWLVKKSLRRFSGFDLMISIAVPYPVHWGVAACRTRKNEIAKIWIADCGDPYCGQENDSFRPPFYFTYIEKWFCRKADFLSVPTSGAIEGYFREFHSKIRVIPQGFKFEDYRHFHKVIRNTKPFFGYGGVFMPGRRDPTELLTFLCGLDLDFEFHIYTRTPNLVTPFVEISSGRIRLMDPLPRMELLNEFSKMDFVVNFENFGSKQTPSKLIDYALIEKPILSVRTNSLDREVVREFLSGVYTNGIKIDNISQYQIENVCSKFLKLANV